MGKPAPLPPGVKRVEQGEPSDEHPRHFVRILLPTETMGQNCAPCAPETNLCCGGPYSVHIWHNDQMLRPAVPWIRTRISGAEWFDFVRALDDANLAGTVPFAACLIFPCTFPLLCVQPVCCCLPFQIAEKKRIERENAFHLTLAKYNRYLFMPRGIVARRQCELRTVGGDKTPFFYLRLDCEPAAATAMMNPSRLPVGLRPGTMKFDLQPLTRDEWLDRNFYPCRFPACVDRIPEPRTYEYGPGSGDDPEISDAALAEKFGPRNVEILNGRSVGLEPEMMLRA